MANCLTVEVEYSATRRNAQNMSAELEGDIECLNGVTEVSVEAVTPEPAAEPAHAKLMITLAPHINDVGAGIIYQAVDTLPYIKSADK